jgi:hypothetical protein
MKRRITIALTIAGLLGLAGMLYAANHVFFSPIQDPTFHVGPIGVAAAPADLIATDYCSGTGFTNIDKIDCMGNFSPIAQVLTPNGGGCFELYVAIAPSVSASATPAPFTPRDYFITSGPNIYQLRPPSPPTLFATIPDGGCVNPGDHTGITFDHEGMFGNNMIVTCKGSGGVWRVDGAGTVTNVGFITSNGRPSHLENPAVVPRGFGPFGGQLWVTDEDYPDTVSTVPGAVHAIDSNGNVTLDVVEWHGAEAVLVIPDNPCTFCSDGALFQAITLNEQGPVGIYQYFPADFSGLGGNVLVPSEEGVGTALVTFNGTNYVTSFFDNIPGGTFEGASFADCDVPTPTPTAAATATFTPTPTPTPTATIFQRGSATTADGNGTSLILAKPTGVVAGDVMIANIVLRGGTATQFPSLSGWTNVTTPVDFEGGGAHHRCALLFKVAGASEPSSYTFTWTGNANNAGAIVAFANVNTSTPFDVTPGNYTTGTGTTISGVTSITTVSANAAVLMFAATFENATLTSFSTTSPGALSELYGNVSNSNGTVGAGWNLKAVAGSTGTGSATNSVNHDWGAILLALKPAP